MDPGSAPLGQVAARSAAAAEEKFASLPGSAEKTGFSRIFALLCHAKIFAKIFSL